MKSVIYFTNWSIYGRQFFIWNLPSTYLTHVIYAFANVNPSTGAVYLSDSYADAEIHFSGDSWNEPGTNLYGNFKQLFLLKKKQRTLKVLLSIGGWTYSGNFPSVAASPSLRANFVTTAVALVRDLGLDGLDIDWEYPTAGAQAANYVQLLKELRAGLDAYAQKLKTSAGTTPTFLLSVAAPCGPYYYNMLDIAGMDKYLNFWNLMGYDFAGSWSTVAGHQANIYGGEVSVDAALKAYLAAGVDKKKIIVGMPLYGRAFVGTDGPGKSYTGVGGGSYEDGVWDYKVLPRSGATEYLDSTSIASWSYDKSSRTMISYDTPSCARLKAGYIKSKGLGGAMWWEASTDAPVSGPRCLVKTIVNEFGGRGTLDMLPGNWISYPDSKYDNVKKKMA
ncbi:glycoside hydrolase superfamily [Lipomyces tetrasporus]|uniref:chitinase n=1 Tax=Lipomyces tetrasporus TaxID=54092 RepID=A0AAD7VPS8_9ASCO|nr:glycoside hydrolase superfamily [Lipomyces tetrasporus]KAJ8096789.1 glycoside hydrolase superfamily [Lipomyces tetrasporus]